MPDRPKDINLFFVLSDSKTTPIKVARNYAEAIGTKFRRLLEGQGHKVSTFIVTAEELDRARTGSYEVTHVFFLSHNQLPLAEQIAGRRMKWRITVLTGGRAHGIVDVMDKTLFGSVSDKSLLDFLTNN